MYHLARVPSEAWKHFRKLELMYRNEHNPKMQEQRGKWKVLCDSFAGKLSPYQVKATLDFSECVGSDELQELLETATCLSPLAVVRIKGYRADEGSIKDENNMLAQYSRMLIRQTGTFTNQRCEGQ